MREKLKRIGNDKRHTFQGIFQFNGYKTDRYKNNLEYENPTFMLANLKIVQADSIELITDHIWMNLTKQFLKFGWLESEDMVQFDGRITSYTSKKGINYKIERPSKVKIFRKGVEINDSSTLNFFAREEIVEEIKKQNRNYYEARDFFFENYLSVPNYFKLKENWSEIQAVIVIGEERYTSEQFKEGFKDRNSLIDLYNKIQETDEHDLCQEFYNGLVSQKNRIDSNDVKNYLLKIENVDYGRAYFD